MKATSLFSFILLFIVSCEKHDPYPIHDPDPSKFYANKTILDTICANSIAFDTDGTAWIGTLNQGLVKYGLTQTKIFDSNNSPISNSTIWDIAVDSKNNIWIGTNGLVMYNGEKFTRYDITNSDIPENTVKSVAIDSEDNIWLTSSRSRSGGIAKFDGVSFEVFTPENSPLPVNSANSIAVDKNDNVWIAATQIVMETYLIRISGELWTVYDSVDFNEEICWVRDMEFNSNNKLCGAIDYTLMSPGYNSPFVFCFDGDIMKTYTIDSLQRGFQSLLVDRTDNFWCTYGHGYAFLNGDRWIRNNAELIDQDGITTWNNAYFTIEQASDGNIWIGTAHGIDIIEEKH
jgi:ligand-binding sensor domain-containing protein